MDHKQKQFKTVIEYIERCPTLVCERLYTLRHLIQTMIPEIEESLKYDMPAFSIKGKYVIYFAAWKNHISIYPFSNAMETELPEAGLYTISGKGTIQFPHDKELPLTLISQIIKLRLLEMKIK